MESTKHLTVVALMVLAGVAIIHGCEQSEMQECLTMEPQSQAAQEICKTSQAKIKCMEDLIEKCPDFKAAYDGVLNEMKTTLAGMAQVCNTDSKCSMGKLQACGVMGAPPAADKACEMKDDLTKAVSCVEKILPHCGETMTQQIGPMKDKIKAMIAACEDGGAKVDTKKEGEDASYETKDKTVAGNGTLTVNGTANSDKKVDDKKGNNNGAVGFQVSTTILSILAVPVLVQVFGRL